MSKGLSDPNLPPVKKWPLASKVIITGIVVLSIAATLVVIFSKNLSL